MHRMRCLYLDVDRFCTGYLMQRRASGTKVGQKSGNDGLTAQINFSRSLVNFLLPPLAVRQVDFKVDIQIIECERTCFALQVLDEYSVNQVGGIRVNLDVISLEL